jgi:hypothetical protein
VVTATGAVGPAGGTVTGHVSARATGTNPAPIDVRSESTAPARPHKEGRRPTWRRWLVPVALSALLVGLGVLAVVFWAQRSTARPQQSAAAAAATTTSKAPTSNAAPRPAAAAPSGAAAGALVSVPGAASADPSGSNAQPVSAGAAPAAESAAVGGSPVPSAAAPTTPVPTSPAAAAAGARGAPEPAAAGPAAEVPAIAAPAPEDPASCSLELRSSPADAAVFVDGRAAGSTPVTVDDVPCGQPVTVTVAKARFETWERRITPRPSDRPVAVTLERPKVVFQVWSEPSGATVRVGGSELGVTPLAITVPAYVGVTVEISRTGHQPYARRLTPRPGADNNVLARMVPLPPAVPRR